MDLPLRRARRLHLKMLGSSPSIPSVAMLCASALQMGMTPACSPGRFYIVWVTVPRREPRAETGPSDAHAVTDSKKRAVRLADEMFAIPRQGWRG